MSKCLLCNGDGFTMGCDGPSACVCQRANRQSGPFGHDFTVCPCWRCAELRGYDDGLAPYRARAVDPTKCDHPDDDKAPHSGDSWSCGHCGADVDGPPGVSTFERVMESIFEQEAP